MLKSAQKATRGEGGFTLIELLVVMIIIAILMAVAVPTFLKQKQNAVATKAKANIRQVQNAIESCAATNTSGAVTGTAPERNCTTSAEIIRDEASLTPVFAAGPEQVSITPVGTQGYTITARYLADGNRPGTYVLTNDGAGNISKTCTPVSSKGCPGASGTAMW